MSLRLNTLQTKVKDEALRTVEQLGCSTLAGAASGSANKATDEAANSKTYQNLHSCLILRRPTYVFRHTRSGKSIPAQREVDLVNRFDKNPRGYR